MGRQILSHWTTREVPKGFIICYLTGPNWEIPHLLVKIPILGKVEITVRFGIKSWFGDMGLAQVTPFWTCCFFFFF